MEIVCNAHEQASAMAATYYYRICGRIAPVLVTAGAGCVNAFTGVMAAHFDGIPLLVLSGNEKSMYMNQATTRCMGFQGLMPAIVTTPFTKITVTADTPAVTKLALRALYDSATGHRQGPCWLDIPQDILAMEAA
jgi:acetolactate synthase-1/2/3 large subunit